MKILVTGISGYVGARLAPRLQRDGHEIVGFARDPSRVQLDVPVVRGDAVSGEGLEQAFEGVEVAYFLIHSMESSGNGGFEASERAAAGNFARAARAAGTKRVVYLGGLVPEGGPVSLHLASRLEVEEILLASCPDSVAFRASIVIGAQSRSFRFLVRLVERMPVLIVPGWGSHLTRTLDERDMVEVLARAATSDRVGGQSLDLAGPDTVSYRDLIDRIRHHMLLDRPTVALRNITVTPIASVISSAIAGEDPGLIDPLMESLNEDLLPRDDRAAELLGVRMHSLDSSIEHALREWEEHERLAAR
jgi:uncharacterized protein YbjT (DUF2867 family)